MTKPIEFKKNIGLFFLFRYLYVNFSKKTSESENINVFTYL